MGLSKDGFTIHKRYERACETIDSKYKGDESEFNKIMIFKKTFGNDFTISEYQKIVHRMEYWKLALQEQRAQHMRAQYRAAKAERVSNAITQAYHEAF